MRALLAAIGIAGLLAGSAHADTMKNCAASWSTMSAAAKAKTTYNAYSSACLKNGAVAVKPPAGATGLCKDGTYTMSKSHSGACSRQGGVAKWF